MYRAVTHNIEVSVEPFYMEDRSEPAENRYFWAYRVTIANNSDSAVKLLSRYWRITDGKGRVEGCGGRASSANSRNSIPATATSIRRGAR